MAVSGLLKASYSARKPHIAVAAKNPKKNPPYGPVSDCIPEEYPAKTGAPAAPAMTYITTAGNAILQPNPMAQNKMISVCRVMGVSPFNSILYGATNANSNKQMTNLIR
jgi:hypothetical protein